MVDVEYISNGKNRDAVEVSVLLGHGSSSRGNCVTCRLFAVGVDVVQSLTGELAVEAVSTCSCSKATFNSITSEVVEVVGHGSSSRGKNRLACV